MSTSKRFDAICLAVTVIMLLITILFINGKALGIKEIVREDTEADTSLFSASDLYDDPNTTGATTIELMGSGAKVTGNGAYYANGTLTIAYAGTYVISGQLDGNVLVKADGDDKIWLVLDGVTINSEDSAGIIIEQADKVFLNLRENSTNSIICGEQYTEKAVKDGVDGAIFSRDNLTINGKGSLNVVGNYKHGIVCNDTLKITGGSITVSAKEDGLHANDNIRYRNAKLTISAGDDGITVSNDKNEGDFYIESGKITVTECYEGLEAVNIIVKGGDINIKCSDDGFNAKGTGTDKGIFIYDGNITILNNTGRDADGIDSNGSLYIYGGNVFVSIAQSTGYALDTGTESGGKCVVSGGTVVACGGSGMAETFDEESTQACFRYNLTESYSDNTRLVLEDKDGTGLLDMVIPYSFNSLVISCPELAKDNTYMLKLGDTSLEVELTNMSTSLGSAGMGMGGHGGMGGQMQGGFQRPGNTEGLPEGMEAPSDMELPEGMEAPSGMELPEGMEAPSDMKWPGNKGDFTGKRQKQ